ncbi:hypothetical protein VitviT2T_008707 [Vitis vinifera]|nr:hypothetical protein VitviT2T_008707 [Vitis vinifera]
MLGLEYQSKRGYIGLEYYGRTVGIKIMPVGIHMGRIASVMKLADKEKKVGELKQQFEGKTVLLGVDDMDIFKGINLKLLAMEQLLQQHSKWQGKAVLVQIANPAKGKGADLEEIQAEIRESCRRINEEFGEPGYEPIVLLTDQFQSMRELPITVLLSMLLSRLSGMGWIAVQKLEIKENDRSWLMSSLHQIFSRRYFLRRSALKLFMIDRSNFFFDFRGTCQRDGDVFAHYR